MRKRNRWNTLLGILAFCFVTGTAGAAGAHAAQEDTVIPGVYLDEIDLQGMTAGEIESVMETYAGELKKKEVTILVGEEKVTASLEELGLSITEHQLAEEALAVGKSGNLIKRYKLTKDLETTPMVLSLGKELDEEKVDQFVERCTEYDQKAKNAKIKRENGKFVYTDEVVGRVVDQEATKGELKELFSGSLQDDLTVTATIVEEQPKYTRELVEQCDSVIGKYSTSYASSSAARAGNIANAARLINGKVLYPGEEFSAYELMNPFTSANGYAMAGAYENGKVIDSMGGGVCQVSTTLYNAALYAEMEITQRAEHSMIVNYVEPARDAAISGTYKDLKFKNPTDVPVYIEAYTSGRTLTFVLYGEAKPAGREVKLISVTTATINPGPDKETKDPTKPEGYRRVDQSAHVGKKASLYMAILQDGKEISRTLVNNSSYAASPRYVTIGTKKPDEPDDDDKDDGDNETTTKPSKPSENDPTTETTTEKKEETSDEEA